jgi:hypothetical protein
MKMPPVESVNLIGPLFAALPTLADWVSLTWINLRDLYAYVGHGFAWASPEKPWVGMDNPCNKEDLELFVR